jgi:hypothetical protein
MNKLILIAATCCFALSGAAFADAYKLDAKGKCRDDKGKFAKQELCAAPVTHTYKLDAKKKCRDEKGHFAEAKLCKA